MLPSGLSGKLFPIHLKPKDDELLSSWIVRLSLAHGLTPTEFDLILSSARQTDSKPRESIFKKKDADLNRDSRNSKSATAVFKVLSTLSKRTATPLQRVHETTLDEYEYRLYHKISDSQLYSWIISHDFSGASLKQSFGIQACAACLAQDKVPYFRRRWRFAFTVICPQHKCHLIDRCPACGEAIKFHRSAAYLVHAPTDAMTTCYKCRFDLRHTHRLKSNLQVQVAQEVIDFQEHLIRIAKKGYIKIKGVESASAEYYFRMIYWMLSLVALPHALGYEFQSAIFKHYARNLDISRLPKKYTLESLDVGSRYDLVRVLNRLLIDHPDRYLPPPQHHDLLCRIWLHEWQDTNFWWAGVFSAERARYGQTGDYARKKFRTSDLYIYSDRMRRLVLNPKYHDEYKQLTAYLYLDGLRTHKIAEILVVAPLDVCGWIMEHPASAAVARQAGRRTRKKR